MIILILECMLLGIVAALTGVFYNYTLQAGSIFCKLGMILDDWSENEGGFKGWIANPLGACIYCSTTWITIFSYYNNIYPSCYRYATYTNQSICRTR